MREAGTRLCTLHKSKIYGLIKCSNLAIICKRPKTFSYVTVLWFQDKSFVVVRVAEELSAGNSTKPYLRLANND
jgi:hypothetical protein